ncbi:MAG: peptide chain release factor H, partial [Flavobacterium sp.]|nr:peptide chain release factor H [Flavobacterium sp.]
KVLKIFLEEAKQNKIDYEIIHRENGDENLTLKSVTLLLKGKEINKFLKSWLGSILWIGKSTFRKLHKRSNWFIGIFELEGLEELEFNEKNIQFQTARSQGSGGQNVNKVSSAVRATHIPTGISVVAMDSRSQHQNKKTATERLVQKLEEATLALLKKEVDKKWENQLNIVRGNPKRVFSGTDFKKQNVAKNYSATRQQLKNNLKNYIE